MLRSLKISNSTLILLIVQLFLAHSSAVSTGQGIQLFRREGVEDCIHCLPKDCSSCPSESPICTMTAQTCDTCPKISCEPDKKKQKTSAGTIAGAVIGGFAATAVLGYIAYRTCAKSRRERASMAATAAEKENDFGMLRSARASTHTVASIASTVRTRASNIIQIAYIPGVTNRSTPGTPAHLVPPVPPLPFQDSPVGSQFPRTPNGDIQFAASDLLRASVCTTVNDSRSNRSSVATTIYGGNAVVSKPNVIRAGKAAVVQVKGGSSVATSDAGSPSSEQVPPVPALFTTTGKPIHDAVPPSPAFSIGTTFFNRVNSGRKSGCESTTTSSLDPPRRLVPGRSHVIDENHSTVSYNYDTDDSEVDIPPGHRAKSKFQSQCSSCVTEMDTGSPFSDNNSIIDALPLPVGSGLPPSSSNRTLSMNLSLGKRASTSKISERTISPFDDSNSIEKSC